ncbi:hypothetical protein GZH49_37850 [Nocardia terpenica]|uniref:terpene synthase family protein n=1 Tax=Nocardia terpenica TaxID=455432 RepID=UPI002FE17ADB
MSLQAIATSGSIELPLARKIQTDASAEFAHRFTIQDGLRSHEVKASDFGYSIRPGTEVYFPEPVCRTLAQVNPDYPTIYEHNAAWVRKFIPFESRAGMLRMLAHRYPFWESMIYPSGIAGRVVHSSCFTSLMFEVDDVAFIHGALFERIKGRLDVQPPYGKAFSNIIETFKQNMPPNVFERYLTDWQESTAAMLSENRFRENDDVPDIDTYLAIRRISVRLRPYFPCAEYVHGFDLSEMISSDTELLRAKLLAVDHAMLVNDLFSFCKEYFQGDYFNVIASLICRHGYTLQEAVVSTCAMIEEADSNLARWSTILRNRYAHDLRVQVYLQILNTFCAGNLRWSLETPRYLGYEHGWSGVRLGLMQLYPEGMEMVLDTESMNLQPVTWHSTRIPQRSPR